MFRIVQIAIQKVDNADATSLAALDSLCITFRFVQIVIQKVDNAGATSLATLKSLCIMFRTLQFVLQKLDNAGAADGAIGVRLLTMYLAGLCISIACCHIMLLAVA